MTERYADGTKMRYRHLESPMRPLWESAGIQTRSVDSKYAVTSGSDANHASISGSAIRYNVETPITDSLGSFKEKVSPDAITGANTSDVRLLVNHTGTPIARWCPAKGINTLQLQNQPDGLHYTANVDLRSNAVNDILVALENRSIDQMSYGFSMMGGKQIWSNGDSQRLIQRYGSIVELSICTFPAETSTSAGVDQRDNRALEREIRFVSWCNMQERGGKKISAENKARLSQVLGHLYASGVHVEHMLSLDGDGSIGGAVSGSPNGGPQIGSQDGTGSRTSEELNKAVKKIIKRERIKGSIKDALKTAEENRARRDWIRNGGE